MKYLTGGIVIVLLARIAIACWFTVHTPLWHLDEAFHYQMVRFIIQNQRLPSSSDIPDDFSPSQVIFVQYNQPPLYYLLLVPIVSLFDNTTNWSPYPVPIPLCEQDYRVNYVQHQTDELFYSEGASRGAWVARGVNILLGVFAVYAVWLGVQRLIPSDSLSLWITATFAFSPSTIEFTTWITNDALVLCLGAIFFACVIHWFQYPKMKNAVLLFIIGVLALFTKLTTLYVIPFVFFLLIWKLPAIYRFWTFLVGLLGSTIFIGYNYYQCGFFLCRLHRNTLHFDSLDSFLKTLNLQLFGEGLMNVLQTLIFPLVSITQYPATWVILLISYFFIFSILCSLFFNSQQNRKIILVFCSLIICAIGLGLIRVWWLQVGYFHVRYIAFVLPPLIILSALGVVYLLRSPIYSKQYTLVWLILAVCVPLISYQPVYYQPASFVNNLPKTVTPLQTIYSSGMMLGGYEIENENLKLYFKNFIGQSHPRELVVTFLTQERVKISYCQMVLGTLSQTPEKWKMEQWLEQTITLPKYSGQLVIAIQLRPIIAQFFYKISPYYDNAIGDVDIYFNYEP
jgi:Dolichyl-phosphate-mannose-protein mannosyltransferase